jgi:citronellol/citronellal dehydrogenase
MNDPPRFGPGDAALAALPTVFAPGLFDDRVVLVSGAGTGIGKAIAFLFARLGARLVICGRKPDRLEDAASTLRELSGREVLAVPTSIRDPAQVGALLDAAWERFGGIDVLVNNAGGQFASMAIDFSPKGWHAVIDTNLNGTRHMMVGAARRWIAAGRGGSIVNITAVVDRGLTGMAHTTASRAGVIQMSRVLAQEWAPHGIRVACIGPGAIESHGFNNYREENLPTFYRSNPMLRAGDVHDIAEAVAWLASPGGACVSGETLNVDGGMGLWGDFWPAGRPEWFAPNE